MPTKLVIPSLSKAPAASSDGAHSHVVWVPVEGQEVRVETEIDGEHTHKAKDSKSVGPGIQMFASRTMPKDGGDVAEKNMDERTGVDKEGVDMDISIQPPAIEEKEMGKSDEPTAKGVPAMVTAAPEMAMSMDPHGAPSVHPDSGLNPEGTSPEGGEMVSGEDEAAAREIGAASSGDMAKSAIDILNSWIDETGTKGDEMKKSETTEKSMASLQSGEVTTGADMGRNESLSEGNAAASQGQAFDSDPKSGMPAGEPMGGEQFSDDDAQVEGQMKPHVKPLEQSAGSGGSSDLEASASQQMDPAYEGMEAGPISKAALEEFYGSADGADLSLPLPAWSAHDGRYVSKSQDRPDVQAGVGVAAPAIEKATDPDFNVWKVGETLYSDGEDRRIAKAQNEQGYVVPEPTLGIPNAPLTSMRCCQVCKSTVPSFITACPSCGVDGYAQNPSGGHVIMEKSVAKSIRPSPEQDLHLPAGFSVPDSE